MRLAQNGIGQNWLQLSDGYVGAEVEHAYRTENLAKMEGEFTDFEKQLTHNNVEFYDL